MMRRRVLAALLVGGSLVFSYFVQFNRITNLLIVRQGDDAYPRVIAIARQLQGPVVSPEDPTIAFAASGYIGRSLYLELDAHNVKGNWPDELPGSIEQELSSARYVVEVKSFVPTPMFAAAMARDEFHELSVPELANSAYRIWRRTAD